MRQLNGKQPSEIRAFSQELGAFRKSLESFENYFALRNFLVGYNLTLADAYLAHVLVGPFKYLFEKKTRLSYLPNLTRFMTLTMDSFYFQFGYGQFVLCKKQAEFQILVFIDRIRKTVDHQTSKPNPKKNNNGFSFQTKSFPVKKQIKTQI